MNQIHTCMGPRTPVEALDLLKYSNLPTGSLLGIYTRLLEKDKDIAKEATAFVNANPHRFNEKTVRMAKELSEGKPIGPKKISSSCVEAFKFLKSAGARPVLSITFCPRRPKEVVVLTMNTSLIRFHEPGAATILEYVVASSGRWENVPRTYTVTVLAVSDTELKQLANGFARTVESVELKSDMLEIVAARNKNTVGGLLLERDDLFYDEGVFRATCGDFNRSSEADAWVRNIGAPKANMRVVVLAVPTLMRIEFLEKYITRFDAAMAEA